MKARLNHLTLIEYVVQKIWQEYLRIVLAWRRSELMKSLVLWDLCRLRMLCGIRNKKGAPCTPKRCWYDLPYSPPVSRSRDRKTMLPSCRSKWAMDFPEGGFLSSSAGAV
eukprot:scaffold7659_cov23-Cyclotella_meneghiniana.AAC.1